MPRQRAGPGASVTGRATVPPGSAETTPCSSSSSSSSLQHHDASEGGQNLCVQKNSRPEVARRRQMGNNPDRWVGSRAGVGRPHLLPSHTHTHTRPVLLFTAQTPRSQKLRRATGLSNRALEIRSLHVSLKGARALGSTR